MTKYRQTGCVSNRPTVTARLRVAEGGSSEKYNVRVACFDCNRSKRDTYEPYDVRTLSSFSMAIFGRVMSFPASTAGRNICFSHPSSRLTAWLERRERDAIAYLVEENRLLRRQATRFVKMIWPQRL